MNKSPSFAFFQNMWRMGRVTEEQLRIAAEKGSITAEEFTEITGDTK